MKNFEEKLKGELDKLPYTKHLDDGQYNDGVISGFELGARWVSSLQSGEGEMDHSNLMSYIKKRWEQIEATVKRHGSDGFQIYRTGVEDGAAFGNSTPTEGDNDPVVNDPLTIGYIYNVIDLEEYNVPQCIVDEIFGKGYLLGLNHPTPTEQPDDIDFLPSDKMVEGWFENNINDDSASSAIYKFRLWLNDLKAKVNYYQSTEQPKRDPSECQHLNTKRAGLGYWQICNDCGKKIF